MTFLSQFPRVLLAFLSALLIGNAHAQNGPAEITPLSPPQPIESDGKQEVLEFFAYGCIHCAHLEPKLVQWIAKQPADVKVIRIPASAAIRGIDSVPIFYTLDAMGLEEKLHQKIFDAANRDNVMLGNLATLMSWLEKQGVDTKKFEETLRSFSVQSKINRARRMGTDYKLQYTPSFSVNGRFIVALLDTPERLFATIEKLMAEARASAKITR